MSPAWLRMDTSGALHLALHVQPGAKTTEIAGIHGDALKLRLAAPPVDGKANAALVAYFAQLLKVPKGNVALVAGASSRRKLLRIAGVTAAAMDSLQERAASD